MADVKGQQESKGDGEGEGEREEGEGDGEGEGSKTAGLTGREVGRVQHGAEVHFVPHISSSTRVGVAIHL